jgi:hypothetical protein
MKNMKVVLRTGSFAALFALFFVSFAEAGTLNAYENMSDPFWPVGHVPASRGMPVVKKVERVVDDLAPKGVSDEEVAGWDAAFAKLNIAGISRGGGSVVAIVNGRVIKIGNTFSVMQAGSIYTWRFESVDEKGGLKLARVNVRLVGNGNEDGVGE